MNYKQIIYILIIHYSLFTIHCFAQEGGVKITNKSDKIEVINGKKYFIHTVLKGQTLYSISKAYSVSVDDIVKENPEVKKEPIYPDQKLKIIATNFQFPVAPPPVKKDSFITHIVKSKETVYSLTKKYNVSEEEIRNANPSLNLNLQPGQIIKIPYKPDTINEKKKTSFFNSLFKKSSKTPEQKDTLKKAKVDTISSISKKAERVTPCKDFIRNDVFNVALILPINLDEINDIVTEDIDGQLKPASNYKSLTYIQYYEGAKIAFDSLQNQGLNAKIYVYAVTNDSVSVDKIIKKSELENTNIIFCPQLTSGYKGFIKFAKKHNIRFVTYSQSNIGDLRDYSFTFRLTPSADEQFKQLSLFLEQKYSNENIILVFQHNDSVQCAKFKNLKPQTLKYSEINYAKVGLTGLKEKLKLNSNNILVTFINDEVSLSQYLRNLNDIKEEYNITLFGLQSWVNQNLEKQYLQNLNLNLYSPGFVDYSDNKVKMFLSRFRNEYKTEPNLFAFQAFDAVYYFLNAMLHYGKTFEKCILDSKADLLENDFIFHKTEHGEYENTYLNIYKYEDYKLVKLVH